MVSDVGNRTSVAVTAVMVVIERRLLSEGVGHILDVNIRCIHPILREFAPEYG